MDDNKFEDEVDGLIEWCEDLDYNKYMENWTVLATSAKHDDVPNENALHVLEVEYSIQKSANNDPLRW